MVHRCIVVGCGLWVVGDMFSVGLDHFVVQVYITHDVRTANWFILRVLTPGSYSRGTTVQPTTDNVASCTLDLLSDEVGITWQQ